MASKGRCGIPAWTAFALCLLLFPLVPSEASVIVREFDFPAPAIIDEDGTCLVSIRGLPVVGNAGQPLLPACGAQVLLPQGEEVVSVSVRASHEVEIPVDLPLVWAQPQSRLSMVGPREHALADESIYSGDLPFPVQRAFHVTTETYRGYNIAFFRIYPVTYVGGRDVVVYSPRLTVTIETAPHPATLWRSCGTLRRGVPGDIAEVERLVGDVSAASSYAPDAGPFLTVSALVEPQDTYPYVIITHNTFFSALEPLREHKDSRGLRAKMVSTGQINGQYSGVDLQDKIRNFIKDAYLYWETEYVLLAGDNSIIPHRGLYAEAGYDEDDDIASDLYYAALDGNWNDDGDGLWGEPDEADLVPEVCVGRISVDNATEAANFINKLLKYETAPVVAQVTTGQMVGEILWLDPTWGGDYKDEIKDGSSAYGYTTAGFPPSFTVSTLYDRDIDPDRWDKNDLIPLLNAGRHIVNHMGHSDVTYGLRMYNSDVETMFANDGVSNTYFIVYTQGCYSGSFDNRTGGGLYGDDCLGEHFTYVENAAVAFIGNTRYGWGAHMSTQGANQYYDRQFFDALFGEGLTAIGQANDDSKIDNIPFIDMEAHRWVYYDLVLLGDPSMDIWTDTPGNVTLSRPDVIYVSDNEVEFTVTDGLDPVAGARISVFSDTTYSTGYTDEAGIVYIDPVALQPGSLYVAVTAHNFYSHLDTVPVALAGDPLIIVEGFTLDDDMSGGSLGNSNVKVDAGETIESVVTLKNVGQDSAMSVSAELETTDPYVVIIDSLGAYGDIGPDSSVTPGWSYRYEVSASTPDEHVIIFDLQITHSDTTLVKHLIVPVAAPELVIAAISYDDTLYANGDGCIEPGETFELTLTLHNEGTGDGEGITVYLSEADPYVSIDDDSAFVSLIGSGEEGDPLPPFVIGLTPDCPEFHVIRLTLDIQFANGRQATDSTAVYVGGSLDEDCESGTAGWTHAGLGDGGIDAWHLDDYRNHTAAGTYSWKFGGEGSAKYANNSHGALVTPALCLGSSATLTFWHWIHAELQSETQAWDGGVVEISTDGGQTWSQITPVGGYPYSIYANSQFPFAPGTPCFAWTDDWTQVVFDLSAYEGRARIRFRFGSDSYYNYEGWYIDDISITDDYSSVDIDENDLDFVPARFALHGVRPNPVTSGSTIAFDVPHTARVKLEVFDVTGRVVDILADSVFEPGRHSQEINWGRSLASGVYFIRMRAESFDSTHKVIILN